MNISVYDFAGPVTVLQFGLALWNLRF